MSEENNIKRLRRPLRRRTRSGILKALEPPTAFTHFDTPCFNGAWTSGCNNCGRSFMSLVVDTSPPRRYVKADKIAISTNIPGRVIDVLISENEKVEADNCCFA